MPVSITRRPVGDVVVIEFGENLETTEEVDMAIKLAESKKILFDLNNVSRVSEAAVAQFEWQEKAIRLAGGELKVVHVAKIKSPRTVTRIALALAAFDDEAEAIRSFL